MKIIKRLIVLAILLSIAVIGLAGYLEVSLNKGAYLALVVDANAISPADTSPQATEPPSSVNAPLTATKYEDAPIACPTPTASPLPVKTPEDHGIKQIPKEQAPKLTLPEGFVYIKDIIPEALLEIRYATDHNFTGQIVPGYLSDKASLTLEAAQALKKAADTLKKNGYGIKIYDAYRPKQAVQFFIAWAEKPEDGETKAEFYPDIEKKDLFKLSYIAKRSGHSRGSTVDLTLFRLDTGEDLDMGSPYDFLGPISNHGTDLITAKQAENRAILKDAMKAAGFKELRTEWWHYGLLSEPYPDTYFDFPVQ